MSQLDYSQEPEKIWKASLIKHQNEAHYYLFVLGNYAKAWEIMTGWIGTLNEASQTYLADITKELETAIFDHRTIAAKRTFQIYRLISIHTFTCYLSQGGFGMVQTSTLKPADGTPRAPEKKAYTTVSASLE